MNGPSIGSRIGLINNPELRNQPLRCCGQVGIGKFSVGPFQRALVLDYESYYRQNK